MLAGHDFQAVAGAARAADPRRPTVGRERHRVAVSSREVPSASGVTSPREDRDRAETRDTPCAQCLTSGDLASGAAIGTVNGRQDTRGHSRITCVRRAGQIPSEGITIHAVTIIGPASVLAAGDSKPARDVSYGAIRPADTCVHAGRESTACRPGSVLDPAFGGRATAFGPAIQARNHLSRRPGEFANLSEGQVFLSTSVRIIQAR